MNYCKITRQRFNMYDDLTLLREILAQNPFNNKNKWKDICAAVNRQTRKCFSVRCVKEHVVHLLKLWEKGDRANLSKSGSEEQYEKKLKLLQEVSNLRREFHLAPVNFQEKYVNVQNDILTEEESATIMDPLIIDTTVLSPAYSDNSNILTPADERKFTKSTLSYLNDKYQSNLEIQRKQLELDERKLILEEKKFELEQEKFQLEKREREMKLSMEMKERDYQIRHIEKQQEIIDFLLKDKVK